MGGSGLALLSATALIALLAPDPAQAICFRQQAGTQQQQQQQQHYQYQQQQQQQQQDYQYQHQQQQQQQQQLIINPCHTSYCRRFPYARCEPEKCTARFFVGSTDVTDHCDVDNCVVENGPDVQCNGLCFIDFLSGPYCQPSCDFNNGGCSDEHVCVQDRIFCIRAPCPQPVRCIHKNALCNQEPDTESCGIRERAFFYNATTRRCERFVYGGCERTHHRFSSLSECWGTCHGIRDMCATIRCPAGTRCKINEQNGNAFCEASCEYENGGCSDSEICRMRPVQCITAPCFEVVECVSRREICSQEADVGDCRAAITRYYYNQLTGRCETFSYGGCGGNENNFRTLEECEETCRVIEENPCNLVDCEPHTVCVVNELGAAECRLRISPGPPCAVILCHIDSICRVRPGTNEGYCGPDPCDNHTCADGLQCRLNRDFDVAECVPTNPCIATLCAVGTTCEVDSSGSPVCVPIPHPCSTIECRKPEICRVNPNTERGYCGADPCTTMNCGSNYECLYNDKTDSGECVPTAPCLLQDCPPGQVCRLNEATGEGKCAPPDLRCMVFECPEGTVCQPKRGVMTTVECVTENPCSHIDCGAQQLCRIDQVSGRGYCGIDPCTYVRCANCEYDPETDGPLCGADPCASTLCSQDKICRVDEDGDPECVNPCEDMVCGSLMCRVNPQTQIGYCGLNPCIYTPCREGAECQYDPKLDVAVCVTPEPDPCDSFPCNGGFICKVGSSGAPFCESTPCAFADCGPNARCVFDPETTRARCVGDPDPCDGFSCTGGDICRVNSRSRQPFCGITPCAFTLCFTNTACIYNSLTDSAICVSIPVDACSNVQCPLGTTCEVNERSVAECVRICQDVLCGRPLVCRMNTTTQGPYCGFWPCLDFECEAPGTECRYDYETDGPVCSPTDMPSTDVCDSVICPRNFRCIRNARGNAECLGLTVG